MSRLRVPTLIMMAAFLLATAAPHGASASAVKACKPVLNPYPGTRYEGENLYYIRARNVTCGGARWLAKGAHRKALGITPGLDGYRRLHWHGYKVLGNLRGDHDRYLAVKGAKRVRWRF